MMKIREEDYLAHYGVKGMKWGVRKDRSTSNLKRKTDVVDKIDKTKDSYSIKNKDGKTVAKLKYYDYGIKNFDWVLMADVDTSPRYRGQGLSSKLINQLTKDVEDQTGKGVYCFVKKDNFNAKGLYSKLGFEKIKDYSLDDGDYEIMAKGKKSKKRQFEKMNFG